MVVRLTSKQRIAEDGSYKTTDGNEEFVARFEASLVVEGFEVVNVYKQENIVAEIFGDAFHFFSREFGEVTVIIEAGEVVVLDLSFKFYRFASLFQAAVVDSETYRGKGDEEGDVVYRIAGDYLTDDAADRYFLRLEGEPPLEGKKDIVEPEEDGGQ